MSRRQEWRGLRSRLVRLTLPLAVGIFGRLSFSSAQRLGARAGTLGWRFSRRDRDRTLEHLELAFPAKTEEERTELGKACFRHLGTTAFECLNLMGANCEAIASYVEVEGWENVEAVRADDRPVLIVTGHCGNWELLAATINCRGLGMAVIARQANDPRLNSPILSLRERYGTATINRAQPGASRQLLRTLKNGGALGMLIDQDTSVKGVWVPFFGRQAFTPVGAAEIALRRDVGVIPTFIARQPNGVHRATFQPELRLDTDPVIATAQMTEAIEEQIRRYPEQWVWMHRRWRRRPEETGSDPAAADTPDP